MEATSFTDHTSARPATRDEIRDAIVMVLSTLPYETEMSFFWKDGKQHLNMRVGSGPVQVMYLNRTTSGVGVPTPVVQH